MELSAGLEADGVDDEVGVDVLVVRVGGHDDLVVLPLLCQLQCDLVTLSSGKMQTAIMPSSKTM